MANLLIDVIARDKTKEALGNVDKNVSNVKKSVFNLKNALVAIAGSLVVRQFGALSNEFQSLQNRLKLVTSSTSDLIKVQEKLFAISQRTRGGFSETVELYQKLALQAQNLGLRSGQLSQITENVNKVIAISGVNSIQASSGILQLSQAFASGRLQGDEFRSISENIPPLLDIFAKQLGVTRGELKKLGSEGKITSDIIATALLAETNNINDAFSQLSPTLGQALTTVKNSILNLVGAFNEVTKIADKFSNTLIKISNGLDRLTKSLKIPTETKEIKNRISEITKELEKLAKEEEKVSKSIFKNFLTSGTQIRIKKLKEELELLTTALNKITAESRFGFGESPEQMGRGRQKLAEVTMFEKIRDAVNELNNKELATFETKMNNIHKIIAEGFNKGIKDFSQGFAEAVILGKSLSETFKNMAQTLGVKILSALIEILARKSVELALEKLITKEKQKQFFYATSAGGKGFFNSITSLFGGGGSGLFQGGFGGARASGGTVSKGQPYLVGERGAELFIPNSTGQIAQSARGMGGGAVSVNFNINTLDARGFDELLVRNRGTITQIINSAVNERGAKSLI
jgi:tape measure domain-containing protein